MRLVDWLELFEANKTLTKHSQNTASLPENNRKAGLCRQDRNNSVIHGDDGIVKLLGDTNWMSVLPG